ncbi:MAG: bifunctional enoyl-CoA hydratase/phosphate acetyltransferase [Chloroflexales bacterium]|nr:bifunctional enoyl-CoA hydratase/phosphate acetyltransferase [Chloroflexales bacterium]
MSSQTGTVNQIIIEDTFDGYGMLMRAAEGKGPVVTAVVYPCDEVSLTGPLDAAAAGLITPILIGPAQTISAVACKHSLDLSPYRIIDVEDPEEAAVAAVDLVRAGEAATLMKGSLHTDDLLKAVVSKERGLRTKRRISHAFIMDVPTYNKLLIITDGAVNIAPDLITKRDICQNAIELAQALGVEQPKVAILSAVESINPDIPSTTEAASLCKMADRGQIKGGLLDGPLALDNAISLDAAKTKKIDSPVAGQADILLMPDLESGNVLAKNLIYLARADAAGIVLGARVPIILTSRADNVRTRMASCAVAVLLTAARRQQIGGEAQ